MKTHNVNLTSAQIYQICDALNEKAQAFAALIERDSERVPFQTVMVWQEAIRDQAIIRDSLLLAIATRRAA